MIRNTYTLILLLISVNVFSQINDKAKIRSAASLIVSPISITSIDDKTGYHTSINGRLVGMGVYEPVKLWGTAVDIAYHVTFHLPVIRNDRWSLGLDTYLGIGAGLMKLDTEFVGDWLIEIPCYLYYKNPSILRNWAFLAGYKLRVSPLSTRCFIFGIKSDNLEFYIAPIPMKYYYYLTNDQYVPAFKIWETGIRFLW